MGQVKTMSVDEAIESAEEWIKGVTVYEGASGWRIACKVLADEVMQQRGQIEKMNADLLRFQDKIAALEAEVKEAYKAGYENGLNGGWIEDGPHPPSRLCMCDECKPSFEPD